MLLQFSLVFCVITATHDLFRPKSCSTASKVIISYSPGPSSSHPPHPTDSTSTLDPRVHAIILPPFIVSFVLYGLLRPQKRPYRVQSCERTFVCAVRAHKFFECYPHRAIDLTNLPTSPSSASGLVVLNLRNTETKLYNYPFHGLFVSCRASYVSDDLRQTPELRASPLSFRLTKPWLQPREPMASSI